MMRNESARVWIHLLGKRVLAGKSQKWQAHLCENANILLAALLFQMAIHIMPMRVHWKPERLMRLKRKSITSLPVG